jgi:transposase-like protein
MEGRQRRSFTDDYKRQAVDLVASSGRSIGSVAKELGLRDSSRLSLSIPLDAFMPYRSN